MIVVATGLLTVTLVTLLYCIPRVVPLTLTMRLGHKK
jgi:hypothetical protein